jgi:hypothetical protein
MLGSSLQTNRNSLAGATHKFSPNLDLRVEYNEVVVIGLGLDGPLQRAGPALGLSMDLDKPITECDNCGRGELRESHSSRLYMEIDV